MENANQHAYDTLERIAPHLVSLVETPLQYLVKEFSNFRAAGIRRPLFLYPSFIQ
jgi:hypothetical protein